MGPKQIFLSGPKRLLSSRDYMYRKGADECWEYMKKKQGEYIYREKISVIRYRIMLRLYIAPLPLP